MGDIRERYAAVAGLTNSMWETFGFMMKRNFPLDDYMSISRTGTFREREISILPYQHSWMLQKSWCGPLFHPKDLLGIFPTLFILRRYMAPQIALDEPWKKPCGLCKKVPVYILNLNFSISWRSISMIL